VEVKESPPAIQLHLGLAYIKTNQIIEAMDALEEALKDGGQGGLSEKDRKVAADALSKLRG